MNSMSPQIAAAVASATGKRALMLFNDGARTVAEFVDPVIETLRKYGLEILAMPVSTRALTAQAIRDRKEEVDFVIAAGGDGTLNAVLQGIVGTDLPLGIVPMGTANDLSKTLKIPSDLAAACEIIARGHSRRIDVGRVNDVYFFNEASVGMSVALCRRLTSGAKARFGVLALFYQALWIMKRMRRFRALVSIDGKKEIALHAAQLTIGNSRNFGGFVATDDASIDDRLLDLYSVEFRHWWTYLEALLSLLRRRYDDASSVHTTHARRFEVRTSRPMPIEADGEIVSQTPATFEIVPQSVSVFVPESEDGSA